MLAEAQDVESPAEGTPKKTSHLRVRTDLHEEYSPEEIAKMTELYEGTLSNIEEGEIVKSKVLRVTDTAVILDVGFKSEGAVAIDEFKDPKSLKEGDEIEIHLAGGREFAVSRKPGREEALRRLRAFRGRLPVDFKFDREEANAR